MTQKEFNQFLNTLTDITDVQYACECWHSLTDEEKMKCTANDILVDIQCTYKAKEEMED